ncbi:MAG: hypothetical protein ACRDKZ_02335 [Actinomycetota bacterium]
MVETISPVVHGGRTKSYWGSVVAHVAGATLASGLFGIALGSLGALLRAPWSEIGTVLIASVAALYALREAFRLPIPIFEKRSQVPEWWRDFYSPPVASFLYGAGLGIGFFTFLTYGTYVVVCVAAVAAGDPLIGALCCGSFGLARSVAVVIAAGERGTTGAVVDRLDRVGASNGPRAANVFALATVALVALASLTLA